MDAAGACRVLNEHRHRGLEWTPHGAIPQVLGRGPYDPAWSLQLSDFEAIAIAEKYERRRAAREAEQWAIPGRGPFG